MSTCHGPATSHSGRQLAMAAGFLTFLTAAVARADQVITFADTAALGTDGTISWAGGTAPLIGTDLQITDVTGPNQPGEHTVDFNGTSGVGRLDFQTGPFVGMTPSNDPDCADCYVFTGAGKGDFLTIFGDVPDAGITSLAGLVAGDFIEAVVDPNAGRVSLAIDLGFDQENERLLKYFGIPAGTPFFYNADFIAPPIVLGSADFSVHPIFTQVKNTALPEPSFVGVLAALAGTGLVIRHRLRRPVQQD